jgi:aspartate/methionine/tyrosine aminotransferase
MRAQGKLSKARIINVDRGPAPAFEVHFAGVKVRVCLCVRSITRLSWRLLSHHTRTGNLLQAAVDAGATVVFVASPNNPTGGMVSHEEVRQVRLLRRRL